MQRRTHIKNKRWLKAQKKEKAQWAKPYQIQARRIPLSEVRNLTEKAGVCLEDLGRLRILEIGGMAYTDRVLTGIQTKLKVALDPLIDSYNKISNDCEYICGMGEYIPLKQDSIDLCWCQNAIDHTSFPAMVLREIRRILSSQGHLYISCNVFHSWARPLFPLLDKIDIPHPHHFTEFGIAKLLLSSGFNIEAFFPAQKLKIRNPKVLFGRLLGLRHVAFHCTVNRRNQHLMVNTSLPVSKSQ